MINNKFFFFLLLSLTSFSTVIARSAFCAVPVADVVGKPLGQPHTTLKDVEAAYHQLPISWVSDPKTCPRIYQLLLHMTVTILEENNFEAFIEIPHCMIINKKNEPETLKGWTLKKNLVEMGSPQSHKKLLPLPIVWQENNINFSNQNVAVLVTPYEDGDGSLYCAGTRFVIHNRTPDFLYVYAYDYFKQAFKEIMLDQSMCIFDNFNSNSHEKRENFCELLTMWAHVPGFCVPLVWGGASIGKVWKQEDFYKAEGQIWERPHYGMYPYTGVDASSVILLAAQSLSIPYFCRNSTTASTLLPELKWNQNLQNGDLLWLANTLFAINSIERNTIIAVMSYNAGYGCLIELPLQQLFKDIYTYEQLLYAYHNHVPLTLLNKDGSEAKEIQDFKLLKLPI